MIYGKLGRDFTVKVLAPPTRVETIKYIWSEARAFWATENIAGKLIVEHEYGIVPEVLFEEIWYGTTFCIEAEGVIVERVERK